jgi:hypothetical protein
MSVIASIIAAVRGHRLAVLGEREVGKTHLQTFFRTGRIPTVYAQTLGQPSLGPGLARLITIESMSGKPEKVRVAVKRGYDVPGAAEAVAAWREVLDDATILLYLFRADYIFKGEASHLKRVAEDARLIAGILEDRPRPLKAAALVGTHYDLVSGFQGPSSGANFYRWHRIIEEQAVIAKARLLLAAQLPHEPALVVGSMRTLGDTQELTFRLFARELQLGARA